MKLPKLPSLDLSKLASMKNPLAAAAEWAERMAGEASAPIGTPRSGAKPQPREDPVSRPPEEPAAEAAYSPEAPPAVPEKPVFSVFSSDKEEPDPAPASDTAETEPFPREDPPRPVKPVRPKADNRDVLYTLWSAAIAVGLLGTVVAFLIGAIR